MTWLRARVVVMVAVASMAMSMMMSAACGGDDGGGGGGVSTGLPADQMLSELDAEDAMMVCEAVADSLDAILTDGEQRRIGCTTLAIPRSVTLSADGEPQVDVGMCRQLVDECLAGDGVGADAGAPGLDLDFSEFSEQCVGAGATTQFDGCSATVGAYEACASAAVAQIDSVLSLITCDALAELQQIQQSLADGFDIASLPQCETLAAQCPQVDLGGGDDDSAAAGDPPEG